MKLCLLQHAKISIIVIILILVLVILQIGNENLRNIPYNLNHSSKQSLENPNIRIYDLKKPLDKSISNSIKCRQSAQYHQFSVLLCLHDEKKDLISRFLFESGIWEKHIMSNFYIIKRKEN